MHFRELTDRYSLDKILRSTRTGSVLRATDSRSGQTVAVKLINVPSPAELVQRAPQFEKLATALEALHHANLPQLIDSGFSTEGSAFLVMELLDGRTLDQVSGAPARLLALLYQVLNGLEALGRRGIVHHNLSPDNLLLVTGSQPEKVKILGLGTSIFRGAIAASPENARFSAPELSEAAPGETADWRADLYSFAYTACQVVGAAIGPGTSPVVQLPFALSLELENSEALRQTLERALRRNPAERPSHQEIRDAFRLALGATPPTPAPTGEKAAAGPKLVLPAPTGGYKAPVVPSPMPPPSMPALPDLPPMPALPDLPDMAALPDSPSLQATPAPPAPARPTAVPPLAPPPAAPVKPPAAVAPAPPALSIPSLPPMPNFSRPASSVPPAAAPARPAPTAAAPASPPPPAVDDAGGEMLSSIDDDLLALAAPPAAPAGSGAPAPAGGGSGGTVVPFQRRPAAGGAPGGVSASVAPPPKSPLRQPIVLIAAAAGLVLVLGILYWWVSSGATPAAPPVAETPAAPKPPERRPPAEVLAEAQDAYADGAEDRALAALQSLTAADQSTLPPEGCKALQILQQALSLSAAEHLPDNLAKGLKGDVGRLRLAVMTAGLGVTVPDALRPDLERARGLVDLYNQIAAAADRKASTEVLERFAVLNQQLPNATDPLGVRDVAAAGLEDEAESLARNGKYQEAVSHLDPVLRNWPNRNGLKAKIDGYQRAQKDETTQEALLAELPAIERRHPDEALDKIRNVTPTPHLAAQFATARQRLDEQLAQLDGQAPTVVLRDGFLLDYDRGRTVSLSFRVNDDYKVRSVKFMAKPEGGKMRELPLTVNRQFYTVELSPSFHQNGTVDFYVTATDVSGHTGTFGTPDRPQQLKRREGFRRILR
jgi:tetratricopeptide (TPR) repeat protein